MTTPITHQTTLGELHAEYQRCAGYDLNGSVAEARQFLHVCRALLSPRFPSEAEQGNRGSNSSQVIAVELLQKQLDECRAWLTANDPTFLSATGGGGVVYATNSHGWER
jgi:hypothetical protein